MLQASSAFVMALDSDEELPDEKWLAATQADDDTMDEATAKLLHAPTLRLGETEDDGTPEPVADHGHAVPSGHRKDSAEMNETEMEQIRLQNLEMAKELAELRRLKSSPMTSPPNQKPLFTPEATPRSADAASPEAGLAHAPDAPDGMLKLGEEDMAEELDLSHKHIAVIAETSSLYENKAYFKTNYILPLQVPEHP